MIITDNNLKENIHELENNGFHKIYNFLNKEFSEKIYKCLINDVNWGLATINNGKPELFHNVNSMDELDPSVKTKILSSHSNDKFQFIYNTYMMVTAYIEKKDPNLFLHEVLEKLNSPTSIQYFKNLTQNNNVLRLSVQATRYLPGHYLTQHNDLHSGEKRLYACILGFTKDWNPDWGGLLNILDENGNIVKSIIPEFNTLTIFKVPQNHFVSLVTPLAKTQRLAIAGWLQSQ